MSLEIDRKVLRKYRTHGAPVGRGSYGTVWKAERGGSEGRTEKSSRIWALKKCHD
eukprot:gene21699-53537_t